MIEETEVPQRESQKRQRVPEDPAGSKKAQIQALYTSGVTEVTELAQLTATRPSYVASVLQNSGLISGYFDLYTHTGQPMNVYSRFFQGKLGFKDEMTARKSIELIDTHYSRFRIAKDRAGQHHALMVALTMFDRARWSGKAKEAEIFRDWLLAKLQEDQPPRVQHS
jgi:hypothetical protein